MKTIIIIILTFITVLVNAQNKLVVFGKNTKHFPSVQVSASVKDRHNKFLFPEKFEQKLAIEDMQTKDIVNPMFQQGISDAQSFDANQASNTTTTSIHGTSIIIVFDASQDALSSCGDQMKKLAIKIIRLLDFDHGDQFNFQRCGSVPTLVHSDTNKWLGEKDTADIIAYINDTLTFDSNINMENIFWGYDGSIWGAHPKNSLYPYGPFSVTNNKNVSLYFIMGNNNDVMYPSYPNEDENRVLTRFGNYTAGLIPDKSNFTLRGVFFSHSDNKFVRNYWGYDTTTGENLWIDSVATKQLGFLSFLTGYNGGLNEHIFAINVDYDQAVIDSIEEIFTDDVQSFAFPYRYGIISFNVNPTTAQMNLDTIRFEFSSNIFDFNKEVDFKNPLKFSVEIPNISNDIFITPGNIIHDNFIINSTISNNYKLYSSNGNYILSGKTNETVSTKFLNNGMYLIQVENNILKIIVNH